MGTVDTSQDGWEYPCSDDELAAHGDKDSDGKWSPAAATLEQLYLDIEQGGTLTLEWHCIGRVPPSSATSTTPTGDSSPTANMDDHLDADANSDFDFKEEMSSLRLRVRREGEDTLRGSAKKKTTSFDGVVSNMMRHKRMQQRMDMNPNPQH